MKVLHICDTVIGGTGSYLAELLPHQLARFGPDNVLLIMPEQHLPYLDSALIDAGLHTLVFDRPSRLRGLVGMARCFFQAIRSFAPDIVHAHSSGAGAVLRALRFRFGGKLIFCSHGWAFDIPGRLSSHRIIAWIERILADRADRIVAISQHDYDRAIEIGIPAPRLALIPNGIAREPPESVPALWDDPRIKILFAGRFDRQKGLDILLDAIAPLADRFAVRAIGQPVVSPSRNPFTTPPNVECYGWRDRAHVASQMRAADLLVVPSRWEGFGLVAVEAMRLSLPVAVAAVGGLIDIVDHGRCGLIFPPGDPVALRRRLETITREDLARLALIGHERFLALFTAERMVRDIEALYAETLAS